MTHRVGMIGLGIMGQRMLTAISNHDGFEAGSAWDLSPDACAAAKGVQILAGAEKVIRSDVDVVYIATPPSTHIQYARMAIEARKPVFCEKPLAENLEESRKLVKEVKGLPNAVNFPFATHPTILKLEKRMQDGETGTNNLVEIRFHFSEWPRTWQKDAASWLAQRKEGGFLREVFSHFAYLTHRLLGPIKTRTANVTYPASGSETYVMAEMEAGGVPVKLMGGVGGAAPDYNEWTIYGAANSFRIQDWRQLMAAGPDGWREITPDDESRPRLGEQLDALSDMIRGKPHPLPDFAAGLAVEEVVEGLLESVSHP